MGPAYPIFAIWVPLRQTDVQIPDLLNDLSTSSFDWLRLIYCIGWLRPMVRCSQDTLFHHRQQHVILQRAIRRPQTSPPTPKKSLPKPLGQLPMARLHTRAAPPLHRTTRQARREIGRHSVRSRTAHPVKIGLCYDFGIAAHEDW